jgi:hypothetical protein
MKLETNSASTARACPSPKIGILVQLFIRPNPIDREAVLRGRIDKWRPNNEFTALPYGRSRKPCLNQDGRVQEMKWQKVNKIRHIQMCRVPALIVIMWIDWNVEMVAISKSQINPLCNTIPRL